MSTLNSILGGCPIVEVQQEVDSQNEEAKLIELAIAKLDGQWTLHYKGCVGWYYVSWNSKGLQVGQERLAVQIQLSRTRKELFFIEWWGENQTAPTYNLWERFEGNFPKAVAV